MFDLAILNLRRASEITNVEWSNITPYAARAKVPDASLVSQITIDGKPVPYAIVNQREIDISYQRMDKVIREGRVKIYVAPSSEFDLEISASFNTISDTAALMQRIFKLLFTTPDTDVLESDIYGVNLAAALRGISVDDKSALIAVVSTALSTLLRQIAEYQLNNPNSERKDFETLIDIRIQDIDIDLQRGEVQLTLEVVTKGGREILNFGVGL